MAVALSRSRRARGGSIALATVVSGNQIFATDLNQYFNLVTGAMTDQPVSFANMINAIGSATITAAPPATANNAGWKIGLYGQTVAMGVVQNTGATTLAALTPTWLSVFAPSAYPANTGSPDTNAQVSLGADGTLRATQRNYLGSPVNGWPAITYPGGSYLNAPPGANTGSVDTLGGVAAFAGDWGIAVNDGGGKVGGVALLANAIPGKNGTQPTFVVDNGNFPAGAAGWDLSVGGYGRFFVQGPTSTSIFQNSAFFEVYVNAASGGGNPAVWINSGIGKMVGIAWSTADPSSAFPPVYPQGGLTYNGTALGKTTGIGNGGSTGLTAPALGTGSGPSSLAVVSWIKATAYVGSSQVMGWVPFFQ